MYITIELKFSIESAISLFRDAGISVEKRDIPVDFKTHNDMNYTDIVHTWTVINPNTQKLELFEPYFIKYLENKKQELFLQEENKLKILNLFEK